MSHHTFCDTPGAHNSAERLPPPPYFFHEYNMEKVTEKIHINDVYNGKRALPIQTLTLFYAFHIRLQRRREVEQVW